MLSVVLSHQVTFKGEAGVDQGGLLTETYTLFFTSVLRPDLGLFETAQDDSKARLFYLPVHGASQPANLPVSRFVV